MSYKRQRTLREIFAAASFQPNDEPREGDTCNRTAAYPGPCYGRCADGPVSADALSEDDGRIVRCYDCGERLSRVPKQIRSRRGTQWTVRAHFRHPRNTQCGGTGESAEHKAAVHAFLVYDFDLFTECKRCCKSMPIVMAGQPCAERAWSHDERPYRLDVAFVEDDEVVAAVEVWHTHATTGQKLQDLNASEVAWCEVRASEVHEAICRGDFCVRDATKQWTCQECDDKAHDAARDDAFRNHLKSMSRLEKDAARARADLTNAQLAHAALEEESKDRIEKIRTQYARTMADTQRARAALDEQFKEQLNEQAVAVREQCAHAREKRCARTLSAYKEMLSEVVEWATGLQECAGETDWTDFTTILSSPHMTLTFGKHAGEHLEAVYRDDAPYIVFIAGWRYRAFDGNKPVPHDTVDVRTTPEQRQYARDMLKGQCLVCFCELDEEWKNRCGQCYHETR